MNCIVTWVSKWDNALKAAKFTMGEYGPINAKVSDKFRERMCMAEHSPLREVVYHVECFGMPWRALWHLVRHHEGMEKFVATSRPDRRPGASTEEYDVMFTINAQALIQISRLRLCNRAWKGTLEVWRQIVNAVSLIDPVVAKYCVPSCVYRGLCPETECCGFISGAKYKEIRTGYEHLVEPNKRFKPWPISSEN